MDIVSAPTRYAWFIIFDTTIVFAAYNGFIRNNKGFFICLIYTLRKLELGFKANIRFSYLNLLKCNVTETYTAVN